MINQLILLLYLGTPEKECLPGMIIRRRERHSRTPNQLVYEDSSKSCHPVAEK
jgi:hypothetical protein